MESTTITQTERELLERICSDAHVVDVDFSSWDKVISLCVVARNEESFLRACIESARPVVDEVVVVDLGSTDRTVEIARGAGARVFRGLWRGDLGAALNLPLAHARGDWIATCPVCNAAHIVALPRIKNVAVLIPALPISGWRQ